MTRKLAINPVTRTNGVYSLEAEVDGGVVVDARSIGPVFRGFEVLLQGRHPLDAPYFTERVCGICSSAHGTAASLALEAAAEAVPPPNGLWVRNLIQGGDFLQNHIRHFYLLALPDYWAGPDVAPLRPHAGQDLRFGRAAEERLTRGYTGALAASRRAHQFAAMIGGKAPFPHGLMPGGATVSPHAQLLVELAAVLKDIRAFIDDHMLPDLELLLATYPEYRTVGTGPADFISYDLFRQPGAAPVFAAGTVVDGRPEPLNQHEIAEDIQHAYFAGTGSHHPAGGQTHPDPAKPGAYSWVKAPRYRGRPMECGPVARAYRPGGAGPSVDRKSVV
jgi:hydrogenase large subunit